MKKASLTEAEDRLHALIDQVRQGETFLILDRGIPVARLVSAIADEVDDPDARLERQGVLRRATSNNKAEQMRMPRPRAANGASIVEALLDERRNGR